MLQNSIEVFIFWVYFYASCENLCLLVTHTLKVSTAHDYSYTCAYLIRSRPFGMRVSDLRLWSISYHAVCFNNQRSVNLRPLMDIWHFGRAQRPDKTACGEPCHRICWLEREHWRMWNEVVHVYDLMHYALTFMSEPGFCQHHYSNVLRLKKMICKRLFITDGMGILMSHL